MTFHHFKMSGFVIFLRSLGTTINGYFNCPQTSGKQTRIVLTQQSMCMGCNALCSILLLRSMPCNQHLVESLLVAPTSVYRVPQTDLLSGGCLSSHPRHRGRRRSPSKVETKYWTQPYYYGTNTAATTTVAAVQHMLPTGYYTSSYQS